MAYSIKQTSVMLLAAGRGKRMLELTKNTPKPLLKIGQKSLIEHHLLSLAALGFEEIVINLGYLGEQICLLYTSPSPRDLSTSRMPSSA